MYYQRYLSVYAACCFVVFASASGAAEKAKRIPPPEWTQEVLDAFFVDAREQLVGPRPASKTAAPAQTAVAQPKSAEGSSAGGKFRWSELIDADTLTAEIRRLNNQLAAVLKKSATFQGGGNLACRRDFGLAAVLFGVLAEYDQEVRWQQAAALLQYRSYQASENCKVASAQSYAAAKEAQAMLAELIRGQPPSGEVPAASADDPRLVDRARLMQSMEQLLKERLQPTIANSRDFRRRSQVTAEQGQLLAVLAEVIQREGYDYVDDDTYLGEARQLGTAAGELSRAARDKNYDAARTAAGKVGQSCSRCHEDYRG